MTDFFDDLERQLVAATPHRAGRVRRARARRVAVLSTTLVALLACGAGIAAAVGGGDGDVRHGTPVGARPTVTTAPPAAGSRPPLGSFTTAVLNGTAVPGLARGVANRLNAAGAKIGNVTNAARQDEATTQVYYARDDCVPAAGKVAEVIGFKGEFSLMKLPRELRVIAGDRADVVVVVGSDQNTSPAP
jgi:hypothetical protein